MKLKYKKAILITAISTMGIGLITISINNNNTQAKEGMKPVTSLGTELMSDNNEEKEEVVSTTPTITVAPTPTPLPVYEIAKDTNESVKQLFVDFYKAKNSRDVEKLQKLLSDSTKVESKDDLKKKTQYIENYGKITTYAKKGYADGSYIVYVYHEIKFTGIKTAAPGLSKFYVVTDTDNKLKIFSGVMDSELQAYYDARNNDEDVIAIIEMTNVKSDEAVKKDKDLQNFWKNIDKLANKSNTASDVPTKSPTKAPTNTPEQTTTKAPTKAPKAN